MPPPYFHPFHRAAATFQAVACQMFAAASGAFQGVLSAQRAMVYKEPDEHDNALTEHAPDLHIVDTRRPNMEYGSSNMGTNT